MVGRTMTGAALLAAVMLAGCAPKPGEYTAQDAIGLGVPPGPAGPVVKPTLGGQVLWHQPCNSVGSFGERLTVDQCGAGPFVQ
jgi:hypothetical protein